MRSLLAFIAVMAFGVVPLPAAAVADVYRDVPYASVPRVDPESLSLDIYAPDGAKNAPVLIMVHGGGWTKGDKTNAVGTSHAPYFNGQGFIYVSINYRLAPEYPFPDFIQDTAAAIAFVHREIVRYGGDRDRIFLMGHSAGAHISALVSVDGPYLAARGLTPAVIKGTVLLDGAAYDIPDLARFGGRRLPRLYRVPFGDDRAGWVTASPTLQVKAATPTPPMLIFHVDRRGAPEASNSLANALRTAGHEATVVRAQDRTHKTMNRSLGAPGDVYAPMIAAFVREHAD
jgi:acetyl esterase/lipase